MSRHLERIDAREARRKLKEGLPVKTKELAVALDVSYGAVLAWRKKPGFPIHRGVVFPSDFEAWRLAQAGLPPRAASAHKPERPQPQAAGISYELSQTHDLPTSLPPKAVRLLGLA